jgi:hypothetical protein
MLMPNDLNLGVWFERPITKDGIPQEAKDQEYAVKHIAEKLTNEPVLKELYDRCIWKNWVTMDHYEFPAWGTLSTDEMVKHDVEGLVSKPLTRFVRDLKNAETQLGHSVPFYMFFIPLGSVGTAYNPVEPYRDLYREVCRTADIRWMDLTEPWNALKISAFPTSEFWSMHHFDYNGHTLLAYLWTHVLIEKHILPLGAESPVELKVRLRKGAKVAPHVKAKVKAGAVLKSGKDAKPSLGRPTPVVKH